MGVAGIFITGTDTGVGKTLVAVGIMTKLRRDGLKVAGMKPVSAGCTRTQDSWRHADAELLMQHASQQHEYALVNPYAFEYARAPAFEAARRGKPIELAVIKAAQAQLAKDSDFLVVEGAGGWRVPLGPSLQTCDLAKELGYPVILVVGLRLGCINHTLLTAETIVRDGLHLQGWIGSAIDPDYPDIDQTLDTLSEKIAAPCLGIVPSRPGISAEETANVLSVAARLPAQT